MVSNKNTTTVSAVLVDSHTDGQAQIYTYMLDLSKF